MSIKPKAVVIISPTESPRQDVYKACFVHHLRKSFDIEVRCAEESATLQDYMINLRDGFRFAMNNTEPPFTERSDLEYAAYVMPTCVDSGSSEAPNNDLCAVVLITIRSRNRHEWAYAYPIESQVPISVVAEVSESITTVMEERNAPEGADSSEQMAVARLIDALRKGIDGAIAVTCGDATVSYQ